MNGHAQPFDGERPIARRHTRRIRLGAVEIGGGAPVSVQSMTKTDTHDVEATVAQIRELEAHGCQIVRVAVADADAVAALARIGEQVRVPLVADIHFDHKLAVQSVAAGVAGLRINPGNIGSAAKVREVVAAAAERQVPIRVGVNGGSLEKAVLARFGGATAEALVESALGHVALLERAGYDQIKISVKASDVARTVRAYRLLAGRTDYPLHLGVTESGTLLRGTVYSSLAIGMLLAEGIGDTIRVSLTEPPAREVEVAQELLRALGLRPPGPRVIACPTCGRAQIDVGRLAHEVERELERYYREQPDAHRPVVAVMGCVVNGPGEAREADIAVAGGKGRAALYLRGRHVRTVQEDQVVPALLEQVRRFSRDRRAR
ncbi:MAG: flavodoxin-dependent (E)-4-hydroxy-3-methylbut-2-enyl-diphosphate synthase [Kiritimatiellae bacterium]|nr:flavodoxin-dependent (E)-4-hydroxy-3-methylbut-2-enyl-diphosphate synthase [Kiritimatiellia bacterium]